MDYFFAFITGGVICSIGQIFIDKTKLGVPKILVGFVITGVVLSTVGIYDKIVDFGGAGATVPLTGFGYLLVEGVKEQINEIGLLGVFSGGLTASSIGISFVLTIAIIMALIFDSKANI